jgi:hypothetical protein
MTTSTPQPRITGIRGLWHDLPGWGRVVAVFVAGQLVFAAIWLVGLFLLLLPWFMMLGPRMVGR